MGLVATILIIGLALLILEVFVIPGTSIFGIIGVLIMFGGVAYAYSTQGETVGHVALGVASLSTLVFTYIGYKVYSSKIFSLNTIIDSKVNKPIENMPVIGTTGKTITDLRPQGKAIINGKKIDVYSLGEYIESSTSITVIKIVKEKIFVEPKK